MRRLQQECWEGRQAMRNSLPDMELGKLKPESLRFLDPRTKTAIADVLAQASYPKTGGAQCYLCAFVATCDNRLRLHTRQHYTNHICGCGESSFRRDWLLEHIRKERTSATFGSKGCRPGLVYEVYRPSFARFINEIQNSVKEFLPVRPTEPDTRHKKTPPATETGPEDDNQIETTPSWMPDQPGFDQVEPGVFQPAVVKGPVQSAAPRLSPVKKATESSSSHSKRSHHREEATKDRRERDVRPKDRSRVTKDRRSEGDDDRKRREQTDRHARRTEKREAASNGRRDTPGTA